MAWSDAGQRLEALPTAGTGCNFVISDCPALSTPATIAGRCRYQSLIASGMIYVHISYNYLPMEHAIRLHKTLSQLQGWPTEDLHALAEALETLRAARARTQLPGPAGRGGTPGGSL